MVKERVCVPRLEAHEVCSSHQVGITTMGSGEQVHEVIQVFISMALTLSSVP